MYTFVRDAVRGPRLTQLSGPFDGETKVRVRGVNAAQGWNAKQHLNSSLANRPTFPPAKTVYNIRKKRKLDYISIDSVISLLENSIKEK